MIIFICINILLRFLINKSNLVYTKQEDDLEKQEELEEDIKDIEEQLSTIEMIENSLEHLSDKDLEEIGDENGWSDLKENGEPFNKEDIDKTKAYLEEKLKELNEELEKEDSDDETVVPDVPTPRGPGSNSPPPETPPPETPPSPKIPPETPSEPPSVNFLRNFYSLFCTIIIIISDLSEVNNNLFF